LGQRLAVTLGGYQQKGYGTGPLYSVFYEHQWELDGRFNLAYGAGWHRRVYDGDPENVLDSHLRIRWRF